MRVYQFTVPTTKASPIFEGVLVEKFGGFTVADSTTGAWKNGEGKIEVEPVFVYTVAVPEGNQSLLLALVTEFLRGAGEQAAYFAEVGAAQIITL